jgi:alternative ribosome-rescue factor
MAKTPAWQRKAGKNPKGGLNEAGRRSAKKQGMNLKRPVKKGDNPRRASFLARMAGMKGPEYRDGKPTRLLLSLRAWGASSKADARKKAAAEQGQEVQEVKPRNPQAKSLMSKLFKPRVVKPKKGKGSYSRKKSPAGKP